MHLKQFALRQLTLSLTVQDHLPLRKKIFSILRQPFVVQENPGNDKDSEDLHVLHEGHVVFFAK